MRRMHISYDTKGICAVKIDFDVENGVVRNLSFKGGCEGNHKGLSRLVEGMPADEVVSRLKGLTCGPRNSSCPDQLACALEEYLKK